MQEECHIFTVYCANGRLIVLMDWGICGFKVWSTEEANQMT